MFSLCESQAKQTSHAGELVAEEGGIGERAATGANAGLSFYLRHGDWSSGYHHFTKITQFPIHVGSIDEGRLHLLAQNRSESFP